MANDRLEQLLDAWMSDRDRGVMRTATELCTDSPELSDELSRRIQIMMKFEQLADVDQQDTRISQANIDTSHSTDVPESSPLRMQPLPAAIGGFRPLELLGEGGMGAVYLAEDHQLGRRVAVKVMKKELAADPDAKHRFLREARAMAAIEHDNIMTIYTVGEDQGTPFLVMPVLKGETLEDRLRRENRLSNAEIVRIGREIAAGLAAAHSHGLVHRDIKPSNIWLEGSQGRVRILDFGLARPASEDQKVTHSGAILGTPAYMAPEQAGGTDATPRSDLFSLGAVLYRMATGQQPFAGPNILATLSNLANRIPESPHKLNPELPDDISGLIDRLLSKSPGQRPESAQAVLESLQRLEAISLTKIAAESRKQRTSVNLATRSSSRTIPPPTDKGLTGTPKRLMIGGFAGVLLLLAATILRIQTDRGTLIVSIDDKQIEARLIEDGLVLEDSQTGRKWHLTPNAPEDLPSGDYSLPQPPGLTLLVKDDTGAEFATTDFKIKRGGKMTVRVKVLPPQGAMVNDIGPVVDAAALPSKGASPVDFAKEREVALWVLSVGGSVSVKTRDGRQANVEQDQVINEPLTVTKIIMKSNQFLAVRDLERLVVLTDLRELYLDDNKQLNDDAALILSRIPTLRLLSLTKTSLTDQGMAHLAKLPKLTILWIVACHGITDAGLKELASSSTLQGLFANSCPVSIEGLRSLHSLRLSSLTVGTGQTRVTESDLPEIVSLFPKLSFFDAQLMGPPSQLGLSPLAKLPELQELSVRASQVVADEPHRLAAFTQLRKIQIYNDKIPADFFIQLEQIPQVNNLRFIQSTLDNMALKQLAKNSTIRRLSFSDWNGGDSELLNLASMTGLRSLQLQKTKVTEAGVIEFGKLRPDVEIATEFSSKIRDQPRLQNSSHTFDKLSSAEIPESERLDYLPRDVVAVLGTHARKTWGSPFYRNHGALSYSPDGKWICACDFGNIYLFDAATLALQKQLPVQVETSYRPFAFSSNGQKLFIASTATVTDLANPQLATERIPDLPNANLISNSPNDRFVIQKYDSLLMGTRNQVTSKVSHLTPIPDVPGFSKEGSLGPTQEMGISPDGNWLVVGYGSYGYRIFRKQEDTFTPAADIPSDIGHHNARVVFSFTASHKRTLLYGHDRCHLVDLSTDVPQELEAPEDLREVTDICSTADGQMWAATKNRAGAASLLLIGHWIEGHPVLEVQDPLNGGWVSGQVAFSPDGRSLAVMGGVPVLQVTDVSKLLPSEPAHSVVNVQPLNSREQNNDQIDANTAPAVFTQTAISSRGDKMLTVGMDGTVRLQKLDGGVLQTLDSLTTERPLIGAILTSDASRAVTFSRPDQDPSMRSQVWVWNLEHDKLQEIAKFDASEDRMWASVGLLNEGQRLLWGNQIWDISSSTPSVVTEFKKLPPRPVACTWTENEEFVAFSGTDGLVSLYRMSGPVDQPLATAQLPAVPVSLSLSSDGKKLAASFAGGLCKVWNLVDGKFEESLSMPGQWNFTPHQAPPYHMQSTVFSRDGQRIYFSGWGGVGEWNLDENQVTRYWPLPGGTQLSIATDNRHLFLHNGNCTTWILRLTNP